MEDTPQNAYNAGYGWLAESGQQAMEYTSQNDVNNFPINRTAWFDGLNQARIKNGLPPVDPPRGGRLRKSKKSRKTRKTKRRKSYRRRY